MVVASIVIYNNDIEMISNAINSFLNSDIAYKKHLYLVDNSPNDNLKHLVSLSPESITYIFNPTNPGFGAAHNIALKKGIERGATYHLVLNPDVYFDKYVLASIIDFMDANPKLGNLMPKVLYPDGNIQYLANFYQLLMIGLGDVLIHLNQWLKNAIKRLNFVLQNTIRLWMFLIFQVVLCF